MDTSEVKPVANYLGSFDPKTASDNSVLMDYAAHGLIQPIRLFAMKYQVLPCTMISNAYHHGNFGPTSAMIHTTSAIQFLVDEYKLDQNTFLSNANFDFEKKNTSYSDIYIDIGNYLSVHLSGGHMSQGEMDNPSDLKPDAENTKFECFNSIVVYYIPQTIDRARNLISQMTRFKLFPITETYLQMVCHNPQSGFYTSNISIKRPLIKDLRLHYGDDFLEVHEKLLHQLTESDSTGITLLHGLPGTGKTYYIRYLINEIKEKSLIYVPPDLVTEMTKPGFLPFLMQHPNSILIIEDAENIILDRKDNVNPNQAVSNLLNLSDGLLGDAMHQQIITTFNCEMKGIDPALLREGRLVVEHKFDRLSVDNAKKMFAELNIDGADQIQEPMSLAEIYAKKPREKVQSGCRGAGGTYSTPFRHLRFNPTRGRHLRGTYATLARHRPESPDSP